MKKFILATLLLGSTSLVHAAPTLVNADGSSLSELCVAAATSTAPLHDVVAQHGFNRFETETILCNGTPLARFVKRHGTEPAPAAVVVSKPDSDIQLKARDDSPFTALCLAAAVSDEEYQRTRDTLFPDEAGIDSDLHCNGLPLKTFARKFRKQEQLFSSLN